MFQGVFNTLNQGIKSMIGQVNINKLKLVYKQIYNKRKRIPRDNPFR
jgi:hypothetical protein